jgi:5-(carboxyamino)imidazole ribonucleotide mutase
MSTKPKAAVVMGSESDFPIVKKCIEVLKQFDVETEVHIISAHRTPYRAEQFAKNAHTRGINVIIGAAGKAAHLPGILAAYTTLPVIGLPIKSSTLDGLDSLLSIVQMPSGVPVATVAVNGAENAALLAVQILALKYPQLSVKLKDYKKFMEHSVKMQNERLQEEVSKL